MAKVYEEEQQRTAAVGGAKEYDTPRKGLPWWIPLLIALAVIALLYSLFHHRSAPVAAIAPTPATTTATAPQQIPSTQSAVPATLPIDQSSTASTSTSGQDLSVHKGSDITTAKAGQASAQGEPLTDVVTFAAAADKTALIGRKVKLTDVPVVQVISDRAFYVGASAQQQMLVLLDKGMNAGVSGQKVGIQPGAALSLTGIVEAVPTAEILSQQYAVSGSDASDLLKQTAYLHATIAQSK